MAYAAVQIGVDENGLGSRLGPMVVTAVRIELDPARIGSARSFARATAKAGIADSKAACGHGAMAGVEARVLALLGVHLGAEVATLSAFASAVSLEHDADLRADCPPGEAPVACFGDPVPLPAFGRGAAEDDVRAARELLEAGVRVAAVRVGFSCARRLNRARAAGRSRFDVDLDTMVRLIAALGAAPAASDGGAGAAAEVLALCGKVGGRKSYGAALTRLSPLVATLEETPKLSSYRAAGVGEVRFVMDGDATEPAISLASLVGKYARELWMHRLNRYWLRAAPGCEPASGYHDPVTERLVAATALVRAERAIPDDCFER